MFGYIKAAIFRSDYRVIGFITRVPFPSPGFLTSLFSGIAFFLVLSRSTSVLPCDFYCLKFSPEISFPLAWKFEGVADVAKKKNKYFLHFDGIILVFYQIPLREYEVINYFLIWTPDLLFLSLALVVPPHIFLFAISFLPPPLLLLSSHYTLSSRHLFLPSCLFFFFFRFWIFFYFFFLYFLMIFFY